VTASAIKNRISLLSWLSLSLVVTTSCKTNPKASDFEPNQFDTQYYNLILCLDLSRDLIPLAGIVVSGHPNLPPGQHSVILPFESTEAQTNPKLFSTWGSYSRFTILNYIASERIGSTNGVGVVPRIRIYKPEELLGDELSRDPVYIVVSGQDRRFVYRYPTQGQSSRSPQINNLPQDTLEAIAVKLPDNVKQFGDKAVMSEEPKNESEKPEFKIRYYPATLEKGRVPALQLSYLLQPNANTEMFVEYSIRLVGVAFVPLLTVFFGRREEVSDPAKKRVLLYSFGVLQAIFIIGIVTYFLLFNPVTESQMKAIFDTAISLVGGVLTQVTASIMVKPKAA
jgi:hypothetical protein